MSSIIVTVGRKIQSNFRTRPFSSVWSSAGYLSTMSGYCWSHSGGTSLILPASSKNSLYFASRSLVEGIELDVLALGCSGDHELTSEGQDGKIINARVRSCVDAHGQRSNIYGATSHAPSTCDLVEYRPVPLGEDIPAPLHSGCQGPTYAGEMPCRQAQASRFLCVPRRELGFSASNKHGQVKSVVLEASSHGDSSTVRHPLIQYQVNSSPPWPARMGFGREKMCWSARTIGIADV